MTNLTMINMSNFTKLFSCMIIGSSLMVSACDDNDSDNGNDNPEPINNPISTNELNGQWELIDAQNSHLNPVSVLNDIKNQVTLNFNQLNGTNSLGFDVGCNLNGSSYTLSSNNLLLAEAVMSTQKFCSDLDAAENSLKSFFREQIVLTVNKAGDSDILTMKTYDGRVLQWKSNNVDNQSNENKALLQQLKKHRWTLVESTDTNIQTKLDLSDSINSSFLNVANTEANSISYSMGCNNFTGGFTLGENTTLTPSNIINTEKACSSILMSAEYSLNQRMLQGSSLLIEKTDTPILTQTVNNEAKTTLTWQGTKKTFTATVDGEITKRNEQGVQTLKKETEIFDNITFPDTEFCDGSNIHKYGFLHNTLSNIVEVTCYYDESTKIVYSAYVPDTEKTYSYNIELTETAY